LKKEFWGLSFEECKVYGIDIPRRLHVRIDMKQWKFITIQEIDIYEMTWYKIIRLSRSTYILYKVNSKWGCIFLLHGNKGSHKLQTQTKRWNQMFNHLLTWMMTQCHINWKELEMVDKMFNGCYLICGGAFESKVMK